MRTAANSRTTGSAPRAGQKETAAARSGGRPQGRTSSAITQSSRCAAAIHLADVPARNPTIGVAAAWATARAGDLARRRSPELLTSIGAAGSKMEMLLFSGESGEPTPTAGPRMPHSLGHRDLLGYDRCRSIPEIQPVSRGKSHLESRRLCFSAQPSAQSVSWKGAPPGLGPPRSSPQSRLSWRSGSGLTGLALEGLVDPD